VTVPTIAATSHALPTEMKGPVAHIWLITSNLRVSTLTVSDT